MKKKYDEDPRCFWNDREARDTFPSFLVEVAIFLRAISEAHKNGAAGDVLCFAQNRVFAFAASKSLNSK